MKSPLAKGLRGFLFFPKENNFSRRLSIERKQIILDVLIKSYYNSHINS
jgi:hypothetical protein